MTRSRARIASGVVLLTLSLLLIALGIRFWRSESVEQRSVDTRNDMAQDVAGTPTNPDDSPIASPEVALFPHQKEGDSVRQLPSSHLLVEQLPILVELAGAGNPTAACRLALSAIRCRHVDFKRRFEGGFQRNLERGPGANDEALIDAIAKSRETEGMYCDGVDVDELPRIDELPAQAISAMSAAQKTLLVMTRADGNLRRLRPAPGSSFQMASIYVMPDLISANTLGFLMEGYNARVPLALEGLVMLHSPGVLGAPQGVSVQIPDSRSFLKYSLLMERLYGTDALGDRASTMMQAVLSGLPPAEADEILRSVELEERRWRAAGPLRMLPERDEQYASRPESFDCNE